MAKKMSPKEIKDLITKNKNLQDRADHFQDQFINVRDRANDLEKKLSESRVELSESKDNSLRLLANQTMLLAEIVRWHVNPETAKDPFNRLAKMGMATKFPSPPFSPMMEHGRGPDNPISWW